FEEAVRFAVERHAGQTRKIHHEPYILHPMEVAAIVGTMTNDLDTLAAAVLHDTVEDTDTTLDEIEERFGRRVALLVMTETENKRPDQPAAQTWQLRKEETLIMLEHTHDISVKMMWMGDKLSNIRSCAREYSKIGHEVWQVCNQKDPAMQAWYYRTIAHSLRELADYPVYKEFVALVDYIFKDVEAYHSKLTEPDT
ncbi:MAG: HD domain-containing protein, partial [Clostridia bacterium]|nr:HD domain-containing protein [Clostridia bacterium]